MVPNYCQGARARRRSSATRRRHLPARAPTATGGRSTSSGSTGPSARATKVVMVCNPNNPTGAVLTEGEMEAVIEVAASAPARGSSPTRSTAAPRSTPTRPHRRSGAATTRSSSRAGCRRRSRCRGCGSDGRSRRNDVIERIWERHDYTTLTPGVLSDRLTAVAMRTRTSARRILARTRGIIRANLPRLEAWLADQPALRYVRPVAGAIAFAEVDLPIADPGARRADPPRAERPARARARCSGSTTASGSGSATTSSTP